MIYLKMKQLCFSWKAWRMHDLFFIFYFFSIQGLFLTEHYTGCTIHSKWHDNNQEGENLGPERNIAYHLRQVLAFDRFSRILDQLMFAKVCMLFCKSISKITPLQAWAGLHRVSWRLKKASPPLHSETAKVNVKSSSGAGWNDREMGGHSAVWTDLISQYCIFYSELIKFVSFRKWKLGKWLFLECISFD